MENTIEATERKSVCSNCRFWDDWGATPPVYDHVRGECHRRAPRIDPAVVHGSDWPGTSAGDWCGEWEQREEESAS